MFLAARSPIRNIFAPLPPFANAERMYVTQTLPLGSWSSQSMPPCYKVSCGRARGICRLDLNFPRAFPSKYATTASASAT
jgi:hypothetical protein